jgi:hypothetical protein
MRHGPVVPAGMVVYRADWTRYRGDVGFGALEGQADVALPEWMETAASAGWHLVWSTSAGSTTVIVVRRDRRPDAPSIKRRPHDWIVGVWADTDVALVRCRHPGEVTAVLRDTQVFTSLQPARWETVVNALVPSHEHHTPPALRIMLVEPTPQLPPMPRMPR